MMSHQALVMYARPPVLGGVKTRLGPTFTPEESLALYRAMLADGIESLARQAAGGVSPFLSWAGACDPPADIARLLAPVTVEYQIGDDLGERMAGTLQARLRGGYRQAVIIGADTPHLPQDYVAMAFEALQAVDVVLGPSEDGGYYLLGCRRLHPRLFQRMPWGTPGVLRLTRQRIRQGGITCHELPVWYDVDTPADAARLWHDLRHMKDRGAREIPERTRQVLAALVPGRA